MPDSRLRHLVKSAANAITTLRIRSTASRRQSPPPHQAPLKPSATGTPVNTESGDVPAVMPRAGSLEPDNDFEIEDIRVPDCLSENGSLQDIVELARRRKVEQTFRRDLAEDRVHAHEEHLRLSRQELSEANKRLQEVDICIDNLRQILKQAESITEFRVGKPMTRDCGTGDGSDSVYSLSISDSDS